MQMRGAALGGDFRQSVPNFRRRGRPAKNPAADHAQIKPAAADDQRISPPRRDLLDSRARKLRELRHVERLAGTAHIYKMMRHAPAVFGRRFRGAEIHPAIKLARVGVDYLAVGALRHLHRQRGLARSGRPDDKADRASAPDSRRAGRRVWGTAHRRNIRSICPRPN